MLGFFNELNNVKKDFFNEHESRMNELSYAINSLNSINEKIEENINEINSLLHDNDIDLDTLLYDEDENDEEELDILLYDLDGDINPSIKINKSE